jgi:hemoglobin-like flavoprotein
MTSTEIALVQSSFRRLLPALDRVGVLFYARLLELDPVLRLALDGEAATRDRRVVQWVALAVNGLGRPETLEPVVRSAGRRCADIFQDYARLETIGAALLWAVEAAANEPFGSETRRAWDRAYWFLAGLLSAGAHGRADAA